MAGSRDRFCLLLFTVLTLYSSFLLEINGLYNERDHVLLLNDTTFRKTILETGSENAWLVQFFNSWCGHCIAFAPTWKALAEQVQGWKNYIVITAVDCSVMANERLCREYEVHLFPTIKFFKPDVKSGDLGIPYKGPKTDISLRHEIVDYLSNISSDYPSLKIPITVPTKLENIDSLWQAQSSDNKYLLLIFENSSSFIGREVMLDLNAYPVVKVIRALPENTLLLQDVNVSKVPALVLLTRDEIMPHLLQSEFSRESIVNLIKTKLQLRSKLESNQDDLDGDEGLGAGDKPHEKEEETFGNVLDQVYLTDMDKGIHYLLLQEVTLHKELTGESLMALQQFVKILVRYYPGHSSTISLLQNLLDWLTVNKTGVIIKDYLEFFQNQPKTDFLTKSEPWLGCRGSKISLRGYPCSLWVTFHTLTVEAYNNRKKAPYDPLEVLYAISGYIKYFFSCQECSQNFQQMSSTLVNDLVEPADGVLWLWQAHNKVNKRLHGTPSEDPKHPKIQFPSSELCAACQLTTEEGSQWDLPEVLSFLTTHYSRRAIRNESINQLYVDTEGKSKDNYQKQGPSPFLKSEIGNSQDPESGTAVRSYRNVDIQLNAKRLKDPFPLSTKHNQRPLFSSWDFSTIDLSLCVMLYVFSAGILLSVYFIVIVKRRLRKKVTLYKSLASV